MRTGIVAGETPGAPGSSSFSAGLVVAEDLYNSFFLVQLLPSPARLQTAGQNT